MPDWFGNGNTWVVEELAMLVQYNAVKVQHLVQLLPRHTEYDIVRKHKELMENNVTDLEKLQTVLGLPEKIEW